MTRWSGKDYWVWVSKDIASIWIVNLVILTNYRKRRMPTPLLLLFDNRRTDICILGRHDYPVYTLRLTFLHFKFIKLARARSPSSRHIYAAIYYWETVYLNCFLRVREREREREKGKVWREHYVKRYPTECNVFKIFQIYLLADGGNFSKVNWRGTNSK